MTDRSVPGISGARVTLLARWVSPLLILAFGPFSLMAQVASPVAVGFRTEPGLVRDTEARGGTPRSAASLFRAHCLNCHDTDGRGGIGRDLYPEIPNFTNANWQTSQTDAQLRRAIKEGQGRSMPAMKEKLSPDEVASLVTLIRVFQDGQILILEDENAYREEQRKPAPNAAPVARPASPPSANPRNDARREAGALFNRSCRACHGDDGKGEASRASLSEIPNFTDGMWLGRRNPAELTVSILNGRGRHMPAFGNALSKEQARALVRFIQTFGPNETQVVDAPAEDFATRFAELCEEFDALAREFRSISLGPLKSESSVPMQGAQSSASVVR